MVIPTLRRYNSLLTLITDLNTKACYIDEIIIVDSTDDHEFNKLSSYDKVKHYRTTHKNGLYQRYVGSIIAKNSWILFLDNDMEILSSSLFDELPELLNSKSLTGIAISFKDKHDNTTLNKIPKAILSLKNKHLIKIKGIITGYPELPVGKYGFCGLRGPQPSTYSNTQWLGGGAFIANKNIVFKSFNFQFMDLFEHKLGMGEDPLIGFMLSLNGDLMYYPKVTFLHNDQNDSSYSVDLYSYSKRVIFSRLFLSREKSRLTKKPQIIGIVFYLWYSTFRIFGLLANALFKRKKVDILMLKGALSGWVKSFIFNYRYSESDTIRWKELAINEIQKNKLEYTK